MQQKAKIKLQPKVAEKENNRRKLDAELDLLESKISELRVLYEQYFVDVLPQPPDKLRKEVVRMIRHLLKAPFKNSAVRFRLRQVVTRYQTYGTYWERVMKQREEGSYNRDVFKAEMRERAAEEAKLEGSAKSAAERSLRQLFDSYENALRKSGAKTDNLQFEAFKKTMIKRAKDLKKQHGVKKLSYKVVVKDGKVTIKASAGKKAEQG